MGSRKDSSRRGGRAPSQRQLRVGEEVRHALAEMLHRGDFHDPELRSLNVTVTEVRVTPDLRNATAFVTPLGGENVPETVAALRRATPFLRGQVARAVKLKYVPSLSFEPDTSFDYATRIDTLLQDPVVERDLQAGPEAGPEAEAGDEDGGPGGGRGGA
ncbi:MAG TPA: 30S ribosome-binding factor RbfA [Arenibaculum sp.]|nr:30S ribosome-binding factor RbfA [Arenibaculum sp.]